MKLIAPGATVTVVATGTNGSVPLQAAVATSATTSERMQGLMRRPFRISEAQRRAHAHQGLLHRGFHAGLAVDALELVIARHAQPPVGATERKGEPQVDGEGRGPAARALSAGEVIGAHGNVGAGAEVAEAS